MTYLDEIINIFRKGQHIVNLECSPDDHDRLIKSFIPILDIDNSVILSKDDELYGFMSVKEYLEFFSNLKGTNIDLFDVAEVVKIERFLQVKISKLTPSLKKRVLIARALIVKAKLIIIEEPLLNVDRESAKIIVSALEHISVQGTFVLSTSNSFRTVSLLPGNSYHIHDSSLIPIFESIDFKTFSNEYASDELHPIIEIKAEGKMLLVSIEDIVFAESIESVCHVYIKNSYVPTNFTLEELEDKLREYNFFRSHRSYLVNIARVSEIQQWTRNSYVLTLNGVENENIEIPLSKRRYKDFKDQLHSA
ncbi:hypothetical protein G7059_03940 [Erysipelothrix sp. HDW6A]|uniref:LytTR family transcriptional regulator DNA-binding domain-containing protein n=1 Tax=Erysipelothrix sp. HDW6A TaxID=2714928 RepID=UPI00140989AE|nr:LytTR family transcriptional regulator DNA-binding domain-containing protein [Erysipelothrix sp. HDW6A]QIK57056.1 hypothetical protein G7059_03940 [Erysipelothrix sp. HDW6A]